MELWAFSIIFIYLLIVLIYRLAKDRYFTNKTEPNKMVLGIKKYDYGTNSTYYLTLNNQQILGPHFSEKSAQEALENVYSGLRETGENP